MNKKTGFMNFLTTLDDKKFSKWKKASKKKDFGLKKGSGGIPETDINISESNCSYEDEEINYNELENNELENNELENNELENNELEDENKQGIIRKINNAHLVFKRKTEDDRYEELWIYKSSDDIINDLDIKNDILSFTDIIQNKNQSEDGLQKYEVWVVGNVQFLYISGLPE